MKIAFVGDISIGRGINKLIDQHGSEFIFADVKPTLDNYDLRVGNLECCVLDHEPDPDSPKLLGMQSRHAQRLVQAGFDVLGLANNHVLDYGTQGLQSTLDFLQRNQITHFGAGHDLGEATSVRYVEQDDRVIAFIGACDISFCHARAARPGVSPVDAKLISQRIKAAASTADLIVVSIHADVEFVGYPAPWRVWLSRWLIDQGAHIVVQHHPHVMQGIESYHGGLIAYSLGNFVFRIHGNQYQGDKEGVDRSFILGVDINWQNGTAPHIEWHSIPIRITEEHRPVLSEGQEATDTNRQLTTLSHGLSDSRLIRREWRRTARHQFGNAMQWAYYDLARKQPLAALKSLWWPLSCPENRRWLRGLLSGGRL